MKHKLSNKSVLDGGKTLYRIQALKSFSNVMKGDLGGFVESESNLSQQDICWIYNNAQVYGDAHVSRNAKIYGKNWIYGHAEVYENALISGLAHIFDDEWVISPFYLHTPKNVIISCSYIALQIGTDINTITTWKSVINEYGYSKKEKEIYLDAIKLAEKHIEFAKDSIQ